MTVVRARLLTTAAVAAGTALLVGVLGACSGSSGGSSASTTPASGATASAADTGSGPMEARTASQILAASQAAAERARSVTVSGKANGAQVDARLGVDAADSRILNAGHLVQVMRTGGAVYLRGDDAFWTAQVSAEAAKVLHGKYAKLSEAQAATYSAFLGIEGFFANTLKPQGTIKKGAVATVAGHRVITLVDTSDGTVITISLEGPPYPVVIAKSGAAGGTVTFTGWDRPLVVAPPPAAQVVDFSELTR